MPTQKNGFIDDILSVSAFICVYTFEAKQRVLLIKMRVRDVSHVERAICTLLKMMISYNYTPHAHSARFA